MEDDEDEVIAEYPLYSSTTAELFKTETQDIRVVQLQYPLRPAWRQYDTENMFEVKYKPEHRFLTIKVPEDRPDHKVRFSVAPSKHL
jgi:RPC5 protein